MATLSVNSSLFANVITTMFSTLNLLRKIDNSLVNKRKLHIFYKLHQQLESSREPLVLVEKDTNITLIGINREETRNSINENAAQELSVAIRNFEQDATSPVAVLYGVGGGSFSAGYDLKELEQHLETKKLDFLMQSEGTVGPTRRHLEKPLIAAINGFCVAQGLELALMCDLRIMEESAVLGFFNRRFGVPLTDGGTVRLSAAVGVSHALDIISTGRRVLANEALRIGLINRIVATGTALGQAVHTAYCISKFMQPSLLKDRLTLLQNTYTKDSFHLATQKETQTLSSVVFKELQQNLKAFKSTETKNKRTDGWSIHGKQHPDWELKEIEYEEARKKCQTS